MSQPDYTDEIKKRQARYDELEEQVKALNDKEDKEAEPVKQQLRHLHDKYDTFRDPLQAEMRQLSEEKANLKRDGRLANMKLAYDHAIAEGKLGQRALEYIYEQATGQRAPSHFYPEKFRGQGMIKNGIQLIKLMDAEYYDLGRRKTGEGPTRKDCDHVGYMAFYGTKCIGFTGVAIGKHPGDDHHPRSFMFVTEGFPAMTEADNYNESEPMPLEVTVESRYQYGDGEVNYCQKPMAFMDWVKALAELNEDQLEKAVGADLEKTAKMWMDFEGCW